MSLRLHLITTHAAAALMPCRSLASAPVSRARCAPSQVSPSPHAMRCMPAAALTPGLNPSPPPPGSNALPTLTSIPQVLVVDLSTLSSKLALRGSSAGNTAKADLASLCDAAAKEVQLCGTRLPAQEFSFLGSMEDLPSGSLPLYWPGGAAQSMQTLLR